MTASRYTLYGGGVSRSIAVELVLAELGVDYDLVEVDLEKGEHCEPAFLKLNPAGFVPALATPDGVVLHENAAIMLWLAETHEADWLAPAVHDPCRGIFLSKLFFHTSELQPAIKRYFFARRYAPDPGTVAAVRRQAGETALDRWGVLDAYLVEHGPCHLGERFSLLDLHVAVWAAYGLETLDEILRRFQGVRRCFEAAASRRVSGDRLLEFRRRLEP